jgi:hypothetical protein
MSSIYEDKPVSKPLTTIEAAYRIHKRWENREAVEIPND